MMKMTRCFLIGHREASDELIPELTQVIEKHVKEYGVEEFLVGSYGGFDRIAARALVNVKKIHPQIRLTLLLAYHPQQRLVEKPAGFDGTCYPEGMESAPPRLAIIRANQYAVDHADYLIAYVWHPASNARKILEYAQKREQRKGIGITLVGRANHP